MGEGAKENTDITYNTKFRNRGKWKNNHIGAWANTQAKGMERNHIKLAKDKNIYIYI